MVSDIPAGAGQNPNLFYSVNCTVMLLLIGFAEQLLVKRHFLGDVVPALGPAAISVRPVPDCRRSFRQTTTFLKHLKPII